MKARSLLPAVFYKICFLFPGGPARTFFVNCAFYVSDKGFDKRTRKKKSEKKYWLLCLLAPDLCRGAPPRETVYYNSAGVRGRSPRETVANIYDSVPLSEAKAKTNHGN